MTVRSGEKTSIKGLDDVLRKGVLSSTLAVMALRFCPSENDAKALIAETLRTEKSELAQPSYHRELKYFLFKAMRRSFLANIKHGGTRV